MRRARFKHTNYYDSSKLYWVSPFRVTDLCVNCILYRANRDLRWLARRLGKQEVVLEIEGWLDAGYEGFKSLWDEKDGIFKCMDQITGRLCDARTSAGFLPLFAGALRRARLGHTLVMQVQCRIATVAVAAGTLVTQSEHSLRALLYIGTESGRPLFLVWTGSPPVTQVAIRQS